MKEKLNRAELLKNTKQILVFIGPEGSGKTVNALKLKEESGLPYISTGDTIRDLAANDYETKYGELCREMFANSAYLDGATLLEILVRRFSEPDTERGFILDGGMRTVEETERFSEMLSMAGRGGLPVKVVMLHVPEEVTFQRLTGEGGRNRHDDTIEGVTKRLQSFNSTLDKRLELIQLEKNWSLQIVDATPDIDQVYDETLNRVLSPNS